MTKTNEKIHVLADESLGGIKREYVEVNRKAEEGEKIVIVDKRYPGDIYENGDVFTVDREVPPGSGFVGSDEAISEMNSSGLIYLGEYRVLEPTNIVHIDGPDGTERYEMVDREAEVGEKVIHLSELYSDGTVTEVTSVGAGMVDVIEYEDSDGDITCGFSHGCYRVLVPAESSEEEPQPSDPIDVIANLATRVAELERENKRIKEDLGWNEMGAGSIANLRNDVADIRHDIAKLEDRIVHDYATNEDVTDFLYEEVKRLQDEIDTLHKDNRRHGEEIAQLEKGVHAQSQRHLYRQQEIERVWERMDRIESETESLKYAAKETDGKVANLESDSDTRLFTAEEVAALLNAMRERQ
ncbi:hypothetical protein [Bacillus licheniformis]|uniref:hypothetical protein n=1 Tax=Bacillus licheniformis TaxID=1402 RepID=UPI0009B75C85|nr:hypothetical protein [Bacillus licheniformis]ARC72427.1 chromosome partition protein Smc [Bacillus licheniformis]ARW41562.1 uncharacterized protein S100141_00237 [Bacillus licheniformis]ARW53037.1 uncharacterized protein S100027_01038 [Bacillus licheniformis]AXF87694.1 hypothetical protein BLDA23_05140 [Bacillus licheniformis]